MTRVTTDSLDITWSEVPGEDTFTVNWTVDGSVSNSTPIVGRQEFSLTGLPAGTRVEIIVLWDFVCDLPSITQYTSKLREVPA